MLSIDLKNAFEDPRTDNFTVLLIRLIAKADDTNREKLALAYPVEVCAVDIYHNICPYKDREHTLVDWDEIAEAAEVAGRALEYQGLAKKHLKVKT